MIKHRDRVAKALAPVRRPIHGNNRHKGGVVCVERIALCVPDVDKLMINLARRRYSLCDCRCNPVSGEAIDTHLFGNSLNGRVIDQADEFSLEGGNTSWWDGGMSALQRMRRTQQN